jgi:hypothetical protein
MASPNQFPTQIIPIISALRGPADKQLGFVEVLDNHEKDVD